MGVLADQRKAVEMFLRFEKVTKLALLFFEFEEEKSLGTEPLAQEEQSLVHLYDTYSKHPHHTR